MSVLTLPSPAKLNLFLHITGRRADSYHEIQTCFHILDYGDQLHFRTLANREIKLECSDPTLNTTDNLVYQAARLLQESGQIRQGIHIKLDKLLPMGSGLGGGSSNAATSLLALNKLWDCRFSTDQLASLGLKLGADVPVFVRGHSGWAEGIGEKLTPLSLPDTWYLVLTPPCQVSTREIFCHQQLTRDTSPIKIPAFPIPGSKNDCEYVASLLYPEIGAVLEWLTQYAPAQMTGTGASVFARFDSREAANKVLQLRPDKVNGFIARGVNISPVLKILSPN